MMTVDRVLKSFSKAVAQLEKIQKAKEDEVARLEVEMTRLQADSFRASTEAARANRVADNIRELLS